MRGGKMKILRVFPRENSYTPNDDLAFFGNPPLFIPDHDEVHVCCVFTWDLRLCKQLQHRWQGVTDKPVLIGGPALGDAGEEFVPGRYVRQGVVFTSRGCVNNCGFCFVPKREGALRLLPIVQGNIIQDNNFLACPQEHRKKVYQMLKTQSRIEFNGGLEAGLLTDWDIEQMAALTGTDRPGSKVYQMFLAADTPKKLPICIEAITRLRAAGFSQEKIRVYALIGNDMNENLSRLEAIFKAGGLPSAQLFQPEERITYSQKWKTFQRVWERPAAMKEYMATGVKLWERLA